MYACIMILCTGYDSMAQICMFIRNSVAYLWSFDNEHFFSWMWSSCVNDDMWCLKIFGCWWDEMNRLNAVDAVEIEFTMESCNRLYYFP